MNKLSLIGLLVVAGAATTPAWAGQLPAPHAAPARTVGVLPIPANRDVPVAKTVSVDPSRKAESATAPTQTGRLPIPSQSASIFDRRGNL